MEHSYKLLEFNVYNSKTEYDNSDEDTPHTFKDDTKFMIQMFGIDENGKKASIIVDDYQPFFYVKVGNNWGPTKKTAFFEHLKTKVGKYYEDGIISCKLITRKKLYGFDGGKKHRFIVIKFANIFVYNKVKNLWYQDNKYEGERKLLKNGYNFIHNNTNTFIELYEANIPPLLRLFHIREISPSGWIALPISKTTIIFEKTTSCDFEYHISHKHILPLNHKEVSVPYKILSFDIEASSSHGDFPVPIKSYKKLATNIVDYFDDNNNLNLADYKRILREIIHSAFGVSNKFANIELVYPKKKPDVNNLNIRIEKWLNAQVKEINNSDEHMIETIFERANKTIMSNNEELEADNLVRDNDDDDIISDTSSLEEEDEEREEIMKPNAPIFDKNNKNKMNKHTGDIDGTIVDVLCNLSIARDVKINELISSLSNFFPALEGDKITFIGSTFINYGDKDPYLNHCIVLNSCDYLKSANTKIETYDTEREVLLAWTKLVQDENPDIIIGYNIFSFDYEFMFRRSQELDCVEDFLKLSRNNGEICKSAVDYKNPSKIDIDRSSTTVASGTYDLAIIKMNGRLQVDMLNWFRKTENLQSYKLDYVGGHFIGDVVVSLTQLCDNDTQTTRIVTYNMTGLQLESFIHFEEINHNVDYYKNGKKFKVVNICKKEGWFDILGHENPTAKKVKWGLAKDDVTPKDIFRMTHEGPVSRAIIAKYCIQDCNLVHYLFHKVDVITDLVEMSNLCSVPMSFLVFRGQGIKLTSYVAKKCREKGVLIPVIDKGSNLDGYEGAIVLEPKCGLYLEEPVPVGDFASLYPSSMLSENLCPSSKVWTKTYDLAGNLVLETGEKDVNGNYIYDNLPEIEYVNTCFDTYNYIRPTPKAAFKKIKSGYKECRFAQPVIVNGIEEKAIMPSILQELLKARKDTRKLIPKTEDEFMKNILDKRQLAYKVTANSLYGQLGAKTSTFYEPDIAASTTATGRLLLIFAKKVIEGCYGNTQLETKYGMVTTNAEYIYGDTDSVFFKFNLTDTNTGEKIQGTKALELSIDIAQQACHNVSKFLKKPHDFEYEKTYMPFCLLSKKRYVAIKFEFDPTKGKRNEMGIVLKRRDNAPIVKDIYGGVIDILMIDKNIQKAIHYVETYLQYLVDGKIPIEKLIITKSLNSFYKNPKSIAHKVLADRIYQREPGNKPSSGDRIAFVYFQHPDTIRGKGKKNKILQGDRIETPEFIKEHHLPIDYSFYITNQIMKPLLQLFGLVLKDIWLSQKPPRRAKVSKLTELIDKINKELIDEKKKTEKINKIKDKEVKEFIFNKFLRETENIKNGNQSIVKLFNKNNRQ